MKTGMHEASRQRRQGGFTLLEMLIAVVILGILAMVIVPQITSSSDDAKVAATKADLSALRSALEQYYVQHNNTYPGVIEVDGAGNADAAACATGFVTQLAQYSIASGQAGPDKAPASWPANSTILGPYLKGGALPQNPFNNLNSVACDITTTDITTRTADGATGWKFFTKTGVLIANDNGSSGNPAVAHKDY